MSAQIIDGRAIAAQVYSELTTRVAVLKAKGVIPRVAIIHVGTEEMTKRYVTLKENAAIRLGMECVTYHLVEDVSQQRVIELVQKLNADESVHGILVQMPLPDSMDTKTVLDAIDPEKDIDGLHFCNAGKLLNGEPAVIACTPRAVIRILDETGIDIMSKHTVTAFRLRIPCGRRRKIRTGGQTDCNLSAEPQRNGFGLPHKDSEPRRHNQKCRYSYRCCGFGGAYQGGYGQGRCGCYRHRTDKYRRQALRRC